MKLRVIADEIVSDEGYVIARFDPQLLPTRRDRAEALLLQGAIESDWELRERSIEQQDRIEEMAEGLRERDGDIEVLTNLVADLRFQLREMKCPVTK